MTILITGGAGFIGANYILDWMACSSEPVVNVDLLTYAGNTLSLASVAEDPRYHFERADICDLEKMSAIISRYRPRAILNFAAESHVDRSIHGPEAFLRSNVAGTFALLQASTEYWQSLPSDQRSDFRYVQISTDEVYGSLDEDAVPFTETTAFSPNSPYAASKASADHFVNSWHHTYGLPCIITHCSNNYGPYQFPEKLIPLIITKAISGARLPIYGDGLNVRDWIHVSDHCAALRQILERGVRGETYNIGGQSELTNIDLVRRLCAILDGLKPDSEGPYNRLISYVDDRPGHDRRYAINNSKIHHDLGWQPAETIESGLEKTVRWYLENNDWVQSTQSGEYRNWMALNYDTPNAEYSA